MCLRVIDHKLIFITARGKIVRTQATSCTYFKWPHFNPFSDHLKLYTDYNLQNNLVCSAK